MEAINEVHVSEPGLVVVDVAAADDQTAFAFPDLALAENLIRPGGSRCAGCAGSRARTLGSVLSRAWHSPRHDGRSCCCDWLT
ncbi:DUF6207 family protein [Streptomyces sp. NPDC005122]